MAKTSEESRFISSHATGRGQTAKAFLPASTRALLTQKPSHKPPLGGLVCGTSSSSFILGLAVGGRIVFPPLQSVLSSTAGGPRVWGHSRFSPASFGPAGVSPYVARSDRKSVSAHFKRALLTQNRHSHPWGLACGTSSSSFILGLAVWGRVVFPRYSPSFRRRRAACVGTQSILPCSVRTPCWPPVSPALHTPSTRTRTLTIRSGYTLQFGEYPPRLDGVQLTVVNSASKASVLQL